MASLLFDHLQQILTNYRSMSMAAADNTIEQAVERRPSQDAKAAPTDVQTSGEFAATAVALCQTTDHACPTATQVAVSAPKELEEEVTAPVKVEQEHQDPQNGAKKAAGKRCPPKKRRNAARDVTPSPLEAPNLHNTPTTQSNAASIKSSPEVVYQPSQGTEAEQPYPSIEQDSQPSDAIMPLRAHAPLGKQSSRRQLAGDRELPSTIQKTTPIVTCC
jgi:hypothetical protein